MLYCHSYPVISQRQICIYYLYTLWAARQRQSPDHQRSQIGQENVSCACEGWCCGSIKLAMLKGAATLLYIIITAADAKIKYFNYSFIFPSYWILAILAKPWAGPSLGPMDPCMATGESGQTATPYGLRCNLQAAERARRTSPSRTEDAPCQALRCAGDREGQGEELRLGISSQSSLRTSRAGRVGVPIGYPARGYKYFHNRC